MSGEIRLCPKNNCAFKCCQFSWGNYILLYPGELAETAKSVGHLKIVDPDYFGGQKAVCVASDCRTCDNGYKPLDCQSYPLFPTMSGYIKGSKCPLVKMELGEHLKWTSLQWFDLLTEKPEVRDWLAQVKMVGYEIF